MKRSEMESLIKATLDANGYLSDTTPSEEMASILLYELEQAGMAPPEIETKFWNRADNDYHRVNEWENE